MDLSLLVRMDLFPPLKLTTHTGFGLSGVVGYGPIKNHFLISFVMTFPIGYMLICLQTTELDATIITAWSGKMG